jgi:hypothetical protein
MIEFLIENSMPISFLGVWALVLVGVLLQWRFRAILKNHHASEWSRLGSPSFPQQPGTTLGLLRFLWRGDYRRPGDPRLTRVCAWLRGLYVLFVLALLIALVSSFPLFS